MTNRQAKPNTNQLAPTNQPDAQVRAANRHSDQVKELNVKIKSFGKRIQLEDRKILAENLGRLARKLKPDSLLGAKAMFAYAKEDWSKRRRLILLEGEKVPKERFEGAPGKYKGLAEAAGNIMASEDGLQSKDKHLKTALETLLRGSSKLPLNHPQTADLDTGLDVLNEVFERLGEQIAKQSGMVELWNLFQLNPFEKWDYSEAEAREALGHIPLFQKAWPLTDQLPEDQRTGLFATSSSSNWKIPTLPLGHVRKLMHARIFRVPAEIGAQCSKTSDPKSQKKIVTDWLASIDHQTNDLFPNDEYDRSKGYGWALEPIFTISKFELEVHVIKGAVQFKISSSSIGEKIYYDEEAEPAIQPIFYLSSLYLNDSKMVRLDGDDIPEDDGWDINIQNIQQDSRMYETQIYYEFDHFPHEAFPLWWPTWKSGGLWRHGQVKPGQLIGYVQDIGDFGQLSKIPETQLNIDLQLGYTDYKNVGPLGSFESDDILTVDHNYWEGIEFYFNHNDELDNCLPLGSIGSALLKHLSGPTDDNRIDQIIIKMCDLLSASGLKYHNDIIEEYRKNLGLKPTVEGA